MLLCGNGKDYSYSENYSIFMKISKGEEYMSKRLHSWSEKIYHRYLREGRGSGDLADYIPWLHTRDFPSKGMLTRKESYHRQN